jgi:MFS family permease
MVTALGASVTSVGVVEGIAEATALITKIFSGTLSDYLGKRKLITLIGYGMAACTKPLFPLAHSIATVLSARFIDRIGKGIRGAPRDALIGDIAPADMRGACFGLRQSLDTIGAVIGPLLAMVLLALFAGNMRGVLWVAVIPAFMAVAILALGVKEPEAANLKKSQRFHLKDIGQIGGDYWRLVMLASVLTLARFSEAFLILKAQATGLPVALVPMVLVVMNVVYALSAYPAGQLSDRMSRKSILMASAALLIAADLTLGATHDVWMLAAGVSLWGLHMGLSQGLLAAMVTDTSPASLRGTAYGIYNFACGIAMLAASVIAGMLWDGFGPQATFFTGAAFAAGAMISLAFIRDTRAPHSV